MPFNKDRLAEILELGKGDVAEYCDSYLDADTLSNHLEEMEPFIGRKELCQYLGVGESTLTGWLKEDRIPLMAKEAFLLPLVIRGLRDEIRRMGAEGERPRILKNGDIYQICRFEPDESGEAIGEVIADNITSLQNARLMLAGVEALHLLGKCDDMTLDYMIEHFEDTEYESFLESLHELRKNIRMCQGYAWDYEGWREANILQQKIKQE